MYQSFEFTRLKELYQHEIIPNISILIWFGKEIPTEVQQNYSTHNFQENIFLHKEKNPQHRIELIVSQKLMDPEVFPVLSMQCSEKGIVLRDFDTDEEIKKCLNYDLIQEFLKEKHTYVCASDLLRFSLLFHQGGRYFDLDLKLNRAYCPDDENKASLGTTAANGFHLVNSFRSCFELDNLITVKQHIFYLLFCTAGRYYAEKLLLNKKNIFNWTQEVQRRSIMATTGAAINHFKKILEEFSKQNNEVDIQRQDCPYDDEHAHSWEVHHNNNENSQDEYKIFFEAIDVETQQKGTEPNGPVGFMIQKAWEYYPQYRDLLQFFCVDYINALGLQARPSTKMQNKKAKFTLGPSLLDAPPGRLYNLEQNFKAVNICFESSIEDIATELAIFTADEINDSDQIIHHTICNGPPHALIVANFSYLVTCEMLKDANMRLIIDRCINCLSPAAQEFLKANNYQNYKKIIQLMGLLHDSGRRHAGVDLWDGANALNVVENVNHLLNTTGLAKNDIQAIMVEVKNGINIKTETYEEQCFLFGIALQAGDSLHSGHAFYGGAWGGGGSYEPGYANLYQRYLDFRSTFIEIAKEVRKFVPKPNKYYSAVEKYLDHWPTTTTEHQYCIIKSNFAKMIQQDFSICDPVEFPIIANHFNSVKNPNSAKESQPPKSELTEESSGNGLNVITFDAALNNLTKVLISQDQKALSPSNLNTVNAVLNMVNKVGSLRTQNQISEQDKPSLIAMLIALANQMTNLDQLNPSLITALNNLPGQRDWLIIIGFAVASIVAIILISASIMLAIHTAGVATPLALIGLKAGFSLIGVCAATLGIGIGLADVSIFGFFGSQGCKRGLAKALEDESVKLCGCH